MPGLGDRASELSPSLGLEEHIAAAHDVAQELHRPIVVAHSYGGVVARTLDDRYPGQHDAFVYIEALVPEHGQCVLDLVPPDRREFFQHAVRDRGDGWRLPPPTDMSRLGIFDPLVAARVSARFTDHPWRTFTEPVQLRSSQPSGARQYYLFATDREPQPLLPFIERYRRARNWTVLGLEGGHEPMITNPRGLSELLIQAASAGPGKRE